jgi:hypothetical protein
MIYGVSNDNPNHYKAMMTNLLGNCIKDVYICRSGNLHDVLIQFKSINRLKNNQEAFSNALNRRTPVILEYKGEEYKIYEA